MVNLPLSSDNAAFYTNRVDGLAGLHQLAKRASDGKTVTIVFGILVPILVILSGIFAGLTLGYMSLDETQLNVLRISGTP